jgi:hypothetical protein
VGLVWAKEEPAEARRRPAATTATATTDRAANTLKVKKLRTETEPSLPPSLIYQAPPTEHGCPRSPT